MGSAFKKIVLIGILILTYSLFFYFILTQQLNTDFKAFYTATNSYIQNMNPFSLDSYLLFQGAKQPINLNPPFFLQLLTFIKDIPYHTAWLIWSIVSFFMGITGALMSLYLVSTPAYFKKYWLAFILIYLCMFSSLMNTSFSQLGDFLLLFIMVGYYLFLHKKDCWAGLVWGVIIAVKLFPALLFLFVLQQKRYAVFVTMLVTFLICSLWPLLMKGPEIYVLYFKSLGDLLWYGASWNASLYGLIFRILSPNMTHVPFLLIKIIYLLVFFSVLYWYLKTLARFQRSATDHRPFCFTLVIMLVLSPLGWIYYFSLLLMPMTLIWFAINQLNIKLHKAIAAWSLSLFLINFPQGNELYYTEGVLYKLTIGSIYCYGLLLIAYQLSCINKPKLSAIHLNELKNSNYLIALNASLGIGLFVVLYNLLRQL